MLKYSMIILREEKEEEGRKEGKKKKITFTLFKQLYVLYRAKRLTMLMPELIFVCVLWTQSLTSAFMLWQKN